MMNEEGMDALVAALLARGYPREKAEDYAARLGDAIELEPGTGLWIIRADDGSILDRIDPLLTDP